MNYYIFNYLAVKFISLALLYLIFPEIEFITKLIASVAFAALHTVAMCLYFKQSHK